MQAGELVVQSVELVCQVCNYVVLVGRGARIPPCPCGASKYVEVRGEISGIAGKRLRRRKRTGEKAA